MAASPVVKVIYGQPMLPDLARVLACLYEKEINFELKDMNNGKKMSKDILNLQLLITLQSQLSTPLASSWFYFRKFGGVAICIAGLVLPVFSDVHSSDRAGGPNPLKGDLLVIAGSMLYEISNVGEKHS